MSSDGRDGDSDGAREPDAGSASDGEFVACARPPLLPTIELEHSVVRYADRPDRCTLYPSDASGVARLSTWLSVDADTLRSLEEWR